MKLGMIFPGYGSQFVGMGKELYDQSRVMQELFEEASTCLNINFVKLCFASSDAELGKMNHAYTATFLLSSAIAQLLQTEGVMPDIVAGYNFGEYAALFSAGSFNLPDGLYLLNKFALWYHDMVGKHEMLALAVEGLSTHDLRCLCAAINQNQDTVQIAFYDGPHHHVVTGTREGIMALEENLSRVKKVYTDRVGMEVGCHSTGMRWIADQLRMYMQKVDINDAKIPFVEGINGTVVQDGASIREHLVAQLCSPLAFDHVLDRFASYDLIIEIGPGSTLSGLVHAKFPNKHVIAINKRSDIDAAKALCGKSAVLEGKKKEVHGSL